MTAEALDAGNIEFPLTKVYWCGVIVEMIFGLCVLAYGTYQFSKAMPNLPFLLRTFILVLASDWFLAANFLFRDLNNFAKGILDEGTWCTFSGFMAIFTSLGCRMYFAVFAFVAHQMVVGQPVGDQKTAVYLACTWVLAAILAAIWLMAEDTYGSYKGLYCAIKETAYKPYLTAPCFLVTFTSIDCLIYFSWAGYEHMTTAKVASAEAEILLKRGMLHGFSHYLLWGGLIAVGVVTSVGGAVPAYIDLGTAWILKTEPIVDVLLLMGSIEAIMNKPEKKKVGGGGMGEEKTQLVSGRGGITPGAGARPGAGAPPARPTPTAAVRPAPTPTAGAGAPPRGPPATPTAPPKPTPSATAASPSGVPVGSQAAINRPPTTPANAPAPAPSPANAPANPFIPPALQG